MIQNHHDDIHLQSGITTGGKTVLDSGMSFAKVLERMYDTVSVPEGHQPLFRREMWPEGLVIRNCPRCHVILVCRRRPDGTIDVEDQWMDDFDGMFADDWMEVRS